MEMTRDRWKEQKGPRRRMDRARLGSIHGDIHSVGDNKRLQIFSLKQHIFKEPSLCLLPSE